MSRAGKQAEGDDLKIKYKIVLICWQFVAAHHVCYQIQFGFLTISEFWLVSDLCRLFLQSSLLIFRFHQFLFSDEKLFVECVRFLLSLMEKGHTVFNTHTRSHRLKLDSDSKCLKQCQTAWKTYVVQVFPQGDLTADQLVSQVVIFLLQTHVGFL